jgi:hypothetical protein
MFQDYPSKMGIQGCAFLDNQIMKYIDTVQIKERFIEKYTFFFYFTPEIRNYYFMKIKITVCNNQMYPVFKYCLVMDHDQTERMLLD